MKAIKKAGENAMAMMFQSAGSDSETELFERKPSRSASVTRAPPSKDSAVRKNSNFCSLFKYFC